jgi:hypothetical protein
VATSTDASSAQGGGSERPQAAAQEEVPVLPVLPSCPPRPPSPFRSRAQWVAVTFTVIGVLIPTMLLGGWNWILSTLQGPGEVAVYASPTDGCFSHYYSSPAEAKRTADGKEAVGVSDEHAQANLMVTLQADDPKAILITGLKVNVLSKTDLPNSGVVVRPNSSCSIITPHRFTVDLTQSRTVVLPIGEFKDEKAKDLLFKVSESDPEVFGLWFDPGDKDVHFSVEIDWVSAGEHGSKVLDNGGNGYRVMGMPDVPRHYPNEILD